VAALEIASPTVSERRPGGGFPGFRYLLSFELREIGGAEAILGNVDVEWFGNFGPNPFRYSNVFPVDKLSAYSSVRSRDLDWTSSDAKTSVRITVRWIDRAQRTGAVIRVVEIPTP
jgi:hypothetical protein